MTTERDAHLQWARERALEEYQASGQASLALSSLSSDLNKHEATASDQVLAARILEWTCRLACGEMTADQVKEWIDGFR